MMHAKLFGTLCWLAVASTSLAQDELARRASWELPTAETVKQAVLQWLGSRELDEPTRLQLEALWPEEALPVRGPQLLEQVAVTIAVFDDEARELVERCRARPVQLLPPQPALLTDDSRAPFVRHNLRLYYAGWLVQRAYYDEAIELLEGLTPADVVDPASLLFYHAVACHRLLQKEQCLSLVEQLLENERALPERYVTVARLMQADIKPLKADSLDEVARLMDDIRRRLDLGRAGTRVRQEEDDVIAKLDKMIDELEKQRQQQQQNAAGAQGNLQPQNPADVSGNYGGSGPGDVNQKRLRNDSGWGNLPPKERQEALQQISKDLPAHYREVIEEYFRKLAQEDAN